MKASLLADTDICDASAISGSSPNRFSNMLIYFLNSIEKLFMVLPSRYSVSSIDIFNVLNVFSQMSVTLWRLVVHEAKLPFNIHNTTFSVLLLQIFRAFSDNSTDNLIFRFGCFFHWFYSPVGNCYQMGIRCLRLSNARLHVNGNAGIIFHNLSSCQGPKASTSIIMLTGYSDFPQL